MRSAVSASLLVLQTAPFPETTNAVLQHAVRLMEMHLFFAASCVLRLLHASLSETDQPTTALLLARCGVALNSKQLMKFANLLRGTEHAPILQLVNIMHDDELHARMRAACMAEAENAVAPVAFEHDSCIVVCAGGSKLMAQLWCNLWSLVRVKTRLPVVIVHAAEIKRESAVSFSRAFPSLKLSFYNLADSSLVCETQLNVEELRGYQIKLAAMAAVSARRVLLMDADILWIRSPDEMVADAVENGTDAFLFSDFWNLKTNQHDKSASTAFLYETYGVCASDPQEFESGVVFYDRERAWKSIAMIQYMAIHFKYYFALTFGDKDLYFLALVAQGANVPRRSPLPAMLGVARNDQFHSQSMLQSYAPGWESHIHMTLHPMSDDFVCTPDLICRDATKIRFVTRELGGRTVATVGCAIDEATPLPKPSVYALLYSNAFADLETMGLHVS